MSTILITGGCGFLGQYVVRDLLCADENTRIRILDLKKNLCAVHTFDDHPRVEHRMGRDICEYDSIHPDFTGIDTVIHLAGVVSFALRDKELLYRVNIEGTRNVLQAALKNGVKNVLHISSVAALGYADDPRNPVNEDFRFDWTLAERKRKYYMLSKHLADERIAACRDKGLACTVLYPGLMFGPGDITNSARLIRALKDARLPFCLPGGTNIVDVRDVARGIVAALNAPPNRNLLLSGSNLTFNDVNRIIAQKLSSKYPRLVLARFLNAPMYRLLLMAESLTRKKLELTADNVDSAFKFRYFDNTRAAEVLGWTPQIPFEQTIADTIEWMKTNGLLAK